MSIFAYFKELILQSLTSNGKALLGKLNTHSMAQREHFSCILLMAQ